MCDSTRKESGNEWKIEVLCFAHVNTSLQIMRLRDDSCCFVLQDAVFEELSWVGLPEPFISI